MKRATGLGGIFFKADNPEELYAWYEKHLGLQRQGQEAVFFNWRHADDPEKSGMTVVTSSRPGLPTVQGAPLEERPPLDFLSLDTCETIG